MTHCVTGYGPFSVAYIVSRWRIRKSVTRVQRSSSSQIIRDRNMLLAMLRVTVTVQRPDDCRWVDGSNLRIGPWHLVEGCGRAAGCEGPHKTSDASENPTNPTFGAAERSVNQAAPATSELCSSW